MTADYLKKTLFLFFVAAATLFSTSTASAAVESLTLGVGQNDVSGGVIDAAHGFAYFPTDTSPGQIVKVRLSDLSIVGSITISENEPVSGVIDAAHGFAYFGTDSWPGEIVKIDLSTFTEVDSITLSAGQNGLERAAIDTVNDFAYFIPYYGGGKVVKIDINPSHFAEVSTLVLDDGSNSHLNSVNFDTKNGYLYIGTDNVPGRIVKVNLSPFQYVGYISLDNAGNTERYLTGSAIDVGNGFAYFGTSAIASSSIVKIDIPTFSRVGSIITDSTITHVNSGVADTANGYAYFGLYGEGSAPSKLLEVNLSSFTVVASTTLDALGAELPQTALIDDVNGYIYFAGYGTPSVIYRIPLIDTTLPTPGTVTFSHVTSTGLTVSVTGASDNTALTSQPFRYHNVTAGVYSAAISSPWTVTGLTPDTSYTFEVGVQDVVGNWATSTQQATTTLANTHTITVSADSHGSISPSGLVSVNDGTNQTFTITPDAGYDIATLSVDSVPVSTSTSYTFTNVTNDHTIDVAFIIIPIPTVTSAVTVSHSSHGQFIMQIPRVTGTLLSTLPLEFKPTSSFARDLWFSATNDQVRLLQQYLNSHGYAVASTGAGSPGHETNYFGVLTRAAVIRFQKANHIIPAVGYFGPITRGYINAH